MEQLLSFVLGAGTVIVIAVVVVAVRTYFKVNSLESSLANLQYEFDKVYGTISESQNLLHNRIDTEIRNINEHDLRGIRDQIEDVSRETHIKFDELDGRIDSRVDKLDNRIQDELQEVHTRIDDVSRSLDEYIEESEVDEDEFLDSPDSSNQLN